MPPGAESNMDRAPMMGVTLSEAINVGTQPLRPNKLAEAYTEALGQRAVRSKNRREYIREVGSEHREKARRRQEKREKERKERRLNLEDNDKLIEFVQSVVPAKLLKYSKFFSKKKKKEGQNQKRLSMGQIMLAMMHEAEGDSDSDDEDNQEDEAPNGRPSLLRRASHTGPLGDDDAGGSSCLSVRSLTMHMFWFISGHSRGRGAQTRPGTVGRSDLHLVKCVLQRSSVIV